MWCNISMMLICERHTTIWRMHQITHERLHNALWHSTQPRKSPHTTLATLSFWPCNSLSRTHLIYASQMNFPTIKKYKIPQPKSSRLCARDFNLAKTKNEFLMIARWAPLRLWYAWLSHGLLVFSSFRFVVVSLRVGGIGAAAILKINFKSHNGENREPAYIYFFLLQKTSLLASE